MGCRCGNAGRSSEEDICTKNNDGGEGEEERYKIIEE